ncbi:MAG: hypothetical protein PHX25_03945 [Candidatus Pacebacteria bacterium]|nr:hypothetical protein [Candidatus Paceibacterota bacterium]
MKRIFAKWFFFFVFVFTNLCIFRHLITGNRYLNEEEFLYILSLSLFFGLLLSLIWQVFAEKRAYEKYIIEEINYINKLYKNNITTASSLVFDFLSRSKAILQHPDWVLAIGSKKEKIDSFLLDKDCTAEFISGCVTQLSSSLRFGEHDGEYEKLLGIFLGITQSLNYPAKCESFPSFKLVGGRLSNSYSVKENILPFKSSFFFQQLREIRNHFKEKQDELEKEIERLEKLEIEEQK